MTTKGLGVLRPNAAPRYFGRFVIGAVTTSLVALGTSGVALAPADAIQTKTVAATTSTSSAPDIYEQRVQRLVNKRRANHGLPSLRLSTCADGTAEKWSRYLAANDEFFHQSMTNVLDTCDARYAGETLGRGTMTPRKLVRMWMESPGHRAILLSSESRRIGVGATPDGSGWVVAANFVIY